MSTTDPSWRFYLQFINFAYANQDIKAINLMKWSLMRHVVMIRCRYVIVEFKVCENNL